MIIIAYIYRNLERAFLHHICDPTLDHGKLGIPTAMYREEARLPRVW